MRKNGASAAALFSFLLAVGGCSSGGEPTLPAATTGDIFGSVYDAGTGRDLSGALVQAAGVSDTCGHPRNSYALVDCPAGPQRLTASRQHYQDYAHTVDVPAGGRVVHDIYLLPVLTNLSGTITDFSSGQPLEDVQVTVGDEAGFTDALGQYQFPDVPQGPYGTQQITATRDFYMKFWGDVYLSNSDETFDISLRPQVLVRSVVSSVDVRYPGRLIGRPETSCGADGAEFFAPWSSELIVELEERVESDSRLALAGRGAVRLSSGYPVLESYFGVDVHIADSPNGPWTPLGDDLTFGSALLECPHSGYAEWELPFATGGRYVKILVKYFPNERNVTTEPHRDVVVVFVAAG
jgi:hypothetical protein